MIHQKHHIGRIIRAEATAWELACLVKKMDCVNRVPDNNEKIKVIKHMIADLAAISLGIEEISGCLEDAIGEERETI